MATMSVQADKGKRDKQNEVEVLRVKKKAQRPVYKLALQNNARPIISILESMDILATMGRWGDNGWWQPFPDRKSTGLIAKDGLVDTLYKEGFYITRQYPKLEV